MTRSLLVSGGRPLVPNNLEGFTPHVITPGAAALGFEPACLPVGGCRVPKQNFKQEEVGCP